MNDWTKLAQLFSEAADTIDRERKMYDGCIDIFIGMGMLRATLHGYCFDGSDRHHTIQADSEPVLWALAVPLVDKARRQAGLPPTGFQEGGV